MKKQPVNHILLLNSPNDTNDSKGRAVHVALHTAFGDTINTSSWEFVRGINDSLNELLRAKELPKAIIICDIVKDDRGILIKEIESICGTSKIPIFVESKTDLKKSLAIPVHEFTIGQTLQSFTDTFSKATGMTPQRNSGRHGGGGIT